jgi:plastocyanin
VGGWALILGVAAVVVTMAGWGIDALREYRAVVDADRTGHLDAGPAPRWPVATLAVLAVIVTGTLLLTSNLLPNSGRGGAAASGAPGASGPPAGGGAPSAAPSVAADAQIVAENIAFTTTAVEVPANKPFKLAFDNRDQQPHNVDIKDASGDQVFMGQIVTGPKVTVYDVPALKPGQYPFVCSVHSNMTGTITAK